MTVRKNEAFTIVSKCMAALKHYKTVINENGHIDKKLIDEIDRLADRIKDQH